jgi:hypothetical protein
MIAMSMPYLLPEQDKENRRRREVAALEQDRDTYRRGVAVVLESAARLADRVQGAETRVTALTAALAEVVDHFERNDDPRDWPACVRTAQAAIGLHRFHPTAESWPK